MPEPLVISTGRTSAVSAVVHVAGDIDDRAGESVRRVIVGHARAGRLRIRIDASQATSVEDAALDRLVDAARELRAAGGTLTLCGVARERLFRKTGTQGRDVIPSR